MIYYLFDKMSINTLFVLDCTGPIFVFMVNSIFYGVRIRREDLAALLICFLGVSLVVAPEMF